MRVRIESDADATVPILHDVEVGPVSLLEGFNGIGKSSTIRLLQVCGGELPYPGEERTWKTFRDGLGRMSVTVTDIIGAEEIRWSFDSRRWPELAKTKPTDDWFDTILIDGTPSTLATAQSLLTVQRISGESGIVPTLVDDLRRQQMQTRALQEHYEARARNPGETHYDAAAMLDELVGLTAGVSGTGLEQTEVNLERERVITDDAERALASGADQRDRIARARDAQDKLELVADTAPAVEEQLSRTESDVERLEGERAEIDAEIESRISELAGTDADRDELRRVTRLRDRSQMHLDEAREAIADAAAGLDLADDASDLQERLRSLHVRRGDISAEIDRLSTTAAMITVADAVRAALPFSSALQHEDLVPSGYANDTTVAGVAEAVRQQQELRRRTPEPDQVIALRAEDEAMSVAERLLRDVEPLVMRRDKYDRLAAQHAETVEMLTDRLEATSAALLDELRGRRDETGRQYTAALMQRARLRQNRRELYNGGDAATREAALHALLTDLGVSVEQLPEAYEVAVREHARLLRDLEIVRLARDDAEFELRRREENVAAATRRLQTDQGFAWLQSLPAGTGWSMPEHASAFDAAERVRRVHEIASAAKDQLDDLVPALGRIQVALGVTIEQLQGRESQISSTLLVREVQEWASTYLSRYFEDDLLKELLGDVATGIRVDVPGATVIWYADGQRRSRRLEAFSSGQQAFTYAKARLRLLDSGPDVIAQNRLICLDEFGAFMDAERRSQLLAFLRGRAAAAPADSVLLILPLRRSFLDAARSARTETEGARYRELEQRLQDKGYVVLESELA